MKKYFIAVGTKDHVDIGVKQGFMQVCHGKKGQLARLKQNDVIIYYCTSKIFGKKDNYQSITACGVVKDDNIYQYEIIKDFIPWRRDVIYEDGLKSLKIKLILGQLSFIKNKAKWGIYFRSGLVEIQECDYDVIISNMRIFNTQSENEYTIDEYINNSNEDEDEDNTSSESNHSDDSDELSE